MYNNLLGIAANWASILTAIVATIAYGHYRLAQRARRLVLEAYLRSERQESRDEGRRTVMHLMANLAMTEAEVLQAGFQSSRVKAVPGIDDRGRAVLLYFEYDGADVAPPGKF